MSTLNLAIEKCKEWHGEQKRKYTNAPYWTHPIAVSTLLMNISAPSYVQIAAILHDVIEDTGIDVDEIIDLFGNEVAVLVLEVTDVSKPHDGNRDKRKQIDREHLGTASFWGKSIKLADLIDNTKSIVKHDADFAKVYLKEKRKLLEVLGGGHCALLAHARDVLILSEQALEVHNEMV